MTGTNYQYSLEFTVRDYECDLQGVVNNANYQHYIEHARHEFLISKGISFVQLHEEGIDLIVTKVEIDYKYPLKSRDKFIVRLNIQREGNARLVFIQDIYRLLDNKHVAHAKVTGVATKKGRPIPPGKLVEQLGLG
ncbi:MAG: thioesterase family protein [Bacteroidia bacterium]|nr:thioesterase family protein [Bacteroidia bacterium]